MMEPAAGEIAYVTNLDDDGEGSFRVVAQKHPAQEVHF